MVEKKYTEIDTETVELGLVLVKHVLTHNRENGRITYKQLSEAADGIEYWRNMGNSLGLLSSLCKRNGWPLISAVVINDSDNMPGNGFFTEFFPNVKGDIARIETWLQEYNKVYTKENRINIEKLKQYLEEVSCSEKETD